MSSGAAIRLRGGFMEKDEGECGILAPHSWVEYPPWPRGTNRMRR